MIQVRLNAALVMIMTSLIILLVKVRKTNGALMILLCGSWSIGRLVKVDKGSTQVENAKPSPEVVFVCTKLFSALCCFSTITLLELKVLWTEVRIKTSQQLRVRNTNCHTFLICYKWFYRLDLRYCTLGCPKKNTFFCL